MSDLEWYSVRCIFEHDDLAYETETTVYEERIVILRAEGLDDAIVRGEAEAEEYTVSTGDASIRYAGFIDAYRTGEKELRDGMEVYSLMRGTTLPEAEFITRYYDDGTERSQRWSGPVSDHVTGA